MHDGSAHRHEAGFKARTRLAEARERLLEVCDFHGRTAAVPTVDADGRALAEPVRARRAVPHYDRAAMDGFAVRARDTHGAGDRSPALLRLEDRSTVSGGRTTAEDDTAGSTDGLEPGTAMRVHTGSPVPPGADAVVMVEHTDVVGDELEVFDAVAESENVAPVGEDVAADQPLFEAGHRLRPADLGLLRSTGVDEVSVAERPRVAVIPTGEELVDADPGPGEVVETNGLTVSRFVERWGATAEYGDVVTDDEAALRSAITDAAARADLVVTTGGSSVGERDLLPEVIADAGELLVHGIALKPGHPVGFGAVDGTPVCMLPGYPVSCIVTAVQLVRPALAALGGWTPTPHPTTRATLSRKIAGEPGVRSFARVSLDRADDGDGNGESDADGGASLPTATPTRASGAGVLSSVALADGWVVVPESREGIPAGETVPVEHWEWSP